MTARPPAPRRRDLLGAAAGAALAAGCATAGPAGKGTGVGSEGALALDVDVHCHTFCSADLPIVGFVAHHVPGLTEISEHVSRWPELVVRAMIGVVATLTNTVAPTGEAELAALRAAPAGSLVRGVPPLPDASLDEFVKLLARALPFSFLPAQRQLVGRYLDTLYLAAHPRAAIAATLAERFPTVALFTPALVDYDAWSGDQSPTPLATQIQVQAAIARLSIAGRIGRSGARFHPFVAYDPRRELETAGALEMVRGAIQDVGFVGVKLYPPVGFAPLDNVGLQPRQPLAGRLDDALRALYAHCEAEEVPITTHASATNTYALDLRELVAPERWRPVLAAHPTLRLNFGHFGGAETGVVWVNQASALMQEFPNVYADLSSSPLVHDPAYAQRLIATLREVVARHPKVKRRLMYGSDWWLSRLEPDATLAVERFRATLSEALAPVEVGDVMGRNALRFLGLLDDADRARDGKAAVRLRRLYGDAPRPAWLPAAAPGAAAA